MQTRHHADTRHANTQPPCNHRSATNVIGHGVVLHVPGLFEEMQELTDKGVSLDGRLLISDRAHLLFDLHKEVDGAREDELAGEGWCWRNGGGACWGCCGCGRWLQHLSGPVAALLRSWSTWQSLILRPAGRQSTPVDLAASQHDETNTPPDPH